MHAATAATMASPACRTATPRRVGVIHTAPGQALLSALGVLRRPATAADRLGSQYLEGPARYAGYARRVLRTRGATYYLAPIRDDPRAGVPPTTASHCRSRRSSMPCRRSLPHCEPPRRSCRRPSSPATAASRAAVRSTRSAW